MLYQTNIRYLDDELEGTVSKIGKALMHCDTNDNSFCEDKILFYDGFGLKEGDVWVATYTEAVKYLREKQNVNIEAFIEDDVLHIMSELTDERMSYSTFNHPLTIFVSLHGKISIEDSESVITTDKGIMQDIAPGEHVVLPIKEEVR